ncbi:MAG: homoserine dehydrogenase [Thermoproteota archaeon]
MRIILVGCGGVGQSLIHILLRRQEALIQNYGFNSRLVAVVDGEGAAVDPRGLSLAEMLSLKKERGTVGLHSGGGHLGMSALDVLETVEAEVMVEVTPTNLQDGEPALSHIKTAFKTGKHVVTTNKGPLALAMPALAELAQYHNVYLRFSGTVGAGTPVLDLAKKCLLGDRILSIRGILNGTTNYILTEMEKKSITFQQALMRAQELGYAEADPSMDVDGWDTACKLVIMANWIMDQKVTLKDVAIQGIRDVSLETLKECGRRNCTIKLVGSIDERLEVSPVEVSYDDPLCVEGVLNAVTFVSEFAGEETVIGRGAGGMATASAILRDVLDIKQNLATRLSGREKT